MVEMEDGGGGQASAAYLPALRAAGSQFRTFTNVVTGIAGTNTLQSGGQFELQYLAAEDANLGASTTPFQTSMANLARAFLADLIAAAPQMADASIDLFDCADAFAAADTAIPANAKPAGAGRWIIPSRDPSGGTGWQATVYYVDSEGHVVVDRDVPIWSPGNPFPTPHPEPNPPPPAPGS